jgi:hypothetical protein
VVRDSAGASTTVAVTVQAASNVTLFTTAPGSVSLAVGAGVAQTYSIAGGTAPYSSTSSNSSVATVSMPSLTSMIVTGAAVGTSNIVVRDAVGSTVTVGVTVISAPTVALYTSAPSAISAAIGTAFEQTYSIGGGTGPYFVSSSNASIATAVLGGGGNTVVVTGLRVGAANVVVQDSVGTKITIVVTVVQPSTVLQLLPATLSISELNSNAIVLSIYGGTGPYRGFTSDLVRTSVTVVGSTLSIGVGTAGNRCVTATTSSFIPDQSPVLTVIDSLGASATSVMTIVDNGVCP